MSEQHSYAVAGIVLGSYDKCFTDTVPVKRSIEQSFRIVTVRIEVCPLALSLETGCNGIVSQGFFLESHFFQFGISGHQVAHDNRHLYNEFPISIFLFTGFTFFRTVLEVFTFVCLAIFFSPGHGFGVFFVVIDAFVHSTDDFCEVY